MLEEVIGAGTWRLGMRTQRQKVVDAFAIDCVGKRCVERDTSWMVECFRMRSDTEPGLVALWVLFGCHLLMAPYRRNVWWNAVGCVVDDAVGDVQ